MATIHQTQIAFTCNSGKVTLFQFKSYFQLQIFFLGHPVEGILNNKQKKPKFFVWPIAYILIVDISCLTRINFWGFHIFLLNTKQRATKSTNSSLFLVFMVKMKKTSHMVKFISILILPLFLKYKYFQIAYQKFRRCTIL